MYFWKVTHKYWTSHVVSRYDLGHIRWLGLFSVLVLNKLIFSVLKKKKDRHCLFFFSVDFIGIKVKILT